VDGFGLEAFRGEIFLHQCAQLDIVIYYEYGIHFVRWAYLITPL
jgi:hypothetical protein